MFIGYFNNDNGTALQHETVADIVEQKDGKLKRMALVHTREDTLSFKRLVSVRS